MLGKENRLFARFNDVQLVDVWRIAFDGCHEEVFEIEIHPLNVWPLSKHFYEYFISRQDIINFKRLEKETTVKHALLN